MQRRNFLKAAAAVAALQVLPAADLLAVERSPIPKSPGILDAPRRSSPDPWNKRDSGVWVPMTYGVQNTATPTSTYTHQFIFGDGDFALDRVMQTGNVIVNLSDKSGQLGPFFVVESGPFSVLESGAKHLSGPSVFRRGESCVVTIETPGPKAEPFGVFLFGQEKLRV